MDRRAEPFSFEPGEVVIPTEVEVEGGGGAEGGTLYWWLQSFGSSRRPKGSVLDRFTRLADADGEAIAAFVREFGFAGFCDHNLPMSHSHVPYGDQVCEWKVEVERDGRDWYPEPLDLYRKYAGGAKALLDAAADLNVNKVPPDELFRRFVLTGHRHQIVLSRDADGSLAERPRLPQGIKEEDAIHVCAGQIAAEVSDWLLVTQALPRFSWDRPTSTWKFATGQDPWSVLGAVALALAAAIPETKGWVTCSIPGCGLAFTPKKAGTPGRAHFCPDHRKKERWRFSKRRQRGAANGD